MNFISVMTRIAHDIKIAWEDVVKYLPAASELAAIIFPAQTAAIAGVVTSVDLIQQAVATVEQKFAAMGAATGTGELRRAAHPMKTDMMRAGTTFRMQNS